MSASSSCHIMVYDGVLTQDCEDHHMPESADQSARCRGFAGKRLAAIAAVLSVSLLIFLAADRKHLQSDRGFPVSTAHLDTGVVEDAGLVFPRTIQLRNWKGQCLDAGGNLHMYPCDKGNPMQQWIQKKFTGSIRNVGAGCLHSGEDILVSVRSCGGLAGSDTFKQHWTFIGNTGPMKSFDGECLDGGGSVHVWKCNNTNQDQQWTAVPVMRVAPVPAAAASDVPSAAADSFSSTLPITTHAVIITTTPPTTTLPATITTTTGTTTTLPTTTRTSTVSTTTTVDLFANARTFHILDKEGACLDAGGAKLHVWGCDSSKSEQRWENQGHDLHNSMGLIRNNKNGKCLDHPGTGGEEDAVFFETCNQKNPRQMWRISAEEKRVRSADGRCLDSGGDVFHLWTCTAWNVDQRLNVVAASARAPPRTTTTPMVWASDVANTASTTAATTAAVGGWMHEHTTAEGGYPEVQEAAPSHPAVITPSSTWPPAQTTTVAITDVPEVAGAGAAGAGATGAAASGGGAAGAGAATAGAAGTQVVHDMAGAGANPASNSGGDGVGNTPTAAQTAQVPMTDTTGGASDSDSGWAGAALEQLAKGAIAGILTVAAIAMLYVCMRRGCQKPPNNRELHVGEGANVSLMSPEEEQRLGLRDGWHATVDAASGVTYYWHESNPEGTATWCNTLDTQLPPGWHQAWDSTRNRPYYWNQDNPETSVTWKAPTA